MAVRTRQIFCETCAQPRPFDKPGPNHILHLLLSCLTFGLWLIIWFFAVIADSPKEYHCRTCGGQPSSLRPYGKTCHGSGLRLLVLVAVGALLIWHFGRPVSRDVAPKSAIATTRTDINQTETPQATLQVWPTLLATYPDLRGDWQWRDLSGMTYVSVPDPFWDALAAPERKALATELDVVLKTKAWTVVTGRYVGDGKMMLDRNHSRSDVLSGR